MRNARTDTIGFWGIQIFGTKKVRCLCWLKMIFPESQNKTKTRLNSRKYSNMEPIHQCCRNMLKQATHHENFSNSSLICPTMQPPKVHIQGAPSSLAPINGNSQKVGSCYGHKVFPQVLSPIPRGAVDHRGRAHRHGSFFSASGSAHLSKSLGIGFAHLAKRVRQQRSKTCHWTNTLYLMHDGENLSLVSIPALSLFQGCISWKVLLTLW